MSEEENSITTTSEGDNSDDGESENEESVTSENEEDFDDSDMDDFVLNNTLLNNPLIRDRHNTLGELISLENLTQDREATHLNHEELASLGPPEEAEYLGEFNEEEETIKIDLNKKYTLPSCIYFDRRIIMYPGIEIPLMIRHPEEINTINQSMIHYKGLLLMYYGEISRIVSILQIKKLNRDNGNVRCICESIGRGRILERRENSDNHQLFFVIEPMIDCDYELSVTNKPNKLSLVNPIIYPPGIVNVYNKIEKMVNLINKTESICRFDYKNVTEFSFLLSHHFPLNKSIKMKLFECGSTSERLLILSENISSSMNLICSDCESEIGNMRDGISLKHNIFANLYGCVFNLYCVSSISASTFITGPVSTQNCWFSGYFYKYLHCLCGKHLGWVYYAYSSSKEPQRFYGIIRDEVVLEQE